MFGGGESIRRVSSNSFRESLISLEGAPKWPDGKNHFKERFFRGTRVLEMALCAKQAHFTCVSFFFFFLSLLSEAGTKWVLWLYLGVSEHLEDRVCGGMGDSPGRSCYTPVAAEPNSQPRWLYGNDPTAWFC